MTGAACITGSLRTTNSILHHRPPSFAALLAQLSGWSPNATTLGVVPAVCHPHILSGLAEATIPAHVLHPKIARAVTLQRRSPDMGLPRVH